MKIHIKEVLDKKQLKLFVEFPLKLYKNNPYFVPPIISDEIKIFDKTENPVFEHSEARLFLAYKNDEIVGRIALLINYNEINPSNRPTLRFGWFDFIDDYEVSKVLLKKAEDIAKEKGLKNIEGPMGFTNMDKAGMLVFGFNKIATVIGLYNYDYYPKHIEKLNFSKVKEWVEYELEAPESIERVARFSKIIQQKFKLKPIFFKSKKELEPFVMSIFELLKNTYDKLSTYVPLTEKEMIYIKDKFIKFIHLDYLIVIENAHKQIIAFAIMMPSYSEALQKAKGYLYPFGWYHLYKASKKNDTAAFILIGIHPEYQGKGVTSIIFEEAYKIFQKNNIKHLETNPELEDNKQVQLLWQDYNPKIHKRRRTYGLVIND